MESSKRKMHRSGRRAMKKSPSKPIKKKSGTEIF